MSYFILNFKKVLRLLTQTSWQVSRPADDGGGSGHELSRLSLLSGADCERPADVAGRKTSCWLTPSGWATLSLLLQTNLPFSVAALFVRHNQRAIFRILKDGDVVSITFAALVDSFVAFVKKNIINLWIIDHIVGWLLNAAVLSIICSHAMVVWLL